VKRILKWGMLLLTMGAILVACSRLDALQRQFIFRPDKTVGETPADAGLAFESVRLVVDGQNVAGWWIPRVGDRNAPAALYLHGSAFSLSANLPRILKLHEAGFNVLAIDYRGFGASDGDLPSEQSAYADARAAWSELAKRAPNAPRFIYGHSLGGAIAVDLAAGVRDEAGLIVESSFTSVRAMLPHTKLAWVPLAPIQTQYFDSLSKIARACSPLLILHGTNDYRIPTEMATQLFEAAREPKRIVIVPGARHIDIPTRHHDIWRAAMNNLRKTEARPCDP
jgi:uncharacterized protein